MSADDIFQAIARRHSRDLVIGECKTGPTQSASGLLKIDAWIMPKSWTRCDITAYEIKSSRADFLRDTKWRGYLDYCNLLYFAAPPGTIQLEELPPEVGLVELRGTVLRTVRRAIFREVTIPDSLWRYILMWRTTIKREDGPDLESRMERVSRYLRYVREKDELNGIISGRLRSRLAQAECSEREIKYHRESAASAWKEVEALRAGPVITKGLMQDVRRLRDHAQRVLTALEEAGRETTA